MSSVAFAFVLQTAILSTGNPTYADAHKVMAETGKPLVVLVGADWCPACRVMKQTSIPQVQQRGGLNDVAFAVVNTDRESALAQQLTGGGSIPQLVVYSKVGDAWKRQVMIGARGPQEIEAFIRQHGTAAPADTLGSN